MPGELEQSAGRYDGKNNRRRDSRLDHPNNLLLPPFDLRQAAGGVFSAGALFPLEVIKTNLQAKTKRKKSPSSSPPPPPPPPAAAGGDEELDAQGEHRTRSSSGEEDGGAGGGGAQQQQQQQQEGRLVTLARQNLERRQEGEGEPHSVASVAKDVYAREGVAGFYRGEGGPTARQGGLRARTA